MRTAFVTVDFTNTAQTKLSSREPIILGFLGRSFTKMWTGNLFHFTVRVPKKIFFLRTKLHSMVNWILKFLLSCLHKLFITPNNLLHNLFDYLIGYVMAFVIKRVLVILA